MAKKKSRQKEYSFTIVNEDVVEKLRKEGKVKLPKKKISIPKDQLWNEKVMGSKLLQGIMNGDSVGKIAKSLGEVIGKNKDSAVRNARTMVTAAENGGRLDSYRKLDAEGIVQKKEWIATADGRTRETHLEIDGEEVDINENFSNGCSAPGIGGPPEEVWNCRCTMGTHIFGFRKADGSVVPIDYERDETIHDKQMREEKERRKKENG